MTDPTPRWRVGFDLSGRFTFVPLQVIVHARTAAEAVRKAMTYLHEAGVNPENLSDARVEPDDSPTG